MTLDPLIIDDVDDAVAYLTDLGKVVVVPSARWMQRQIRLFAAAHGWQVVGHTRFVEWAAGADVTDGLTLVLDPLIPREYVGVKAHAVRLSRYMTSKGWAIDGDLPADLATLIAGSTVGIIDDVAASGATIRYVSDQVTRAGGRVDKVILCACAEAAVPPGDASQPEWVTFVPGRRNAVHLRDACPFLPFA
jgi:hypothetical protein